MADSPGGTSDDNGTGPGPGPSDHRLAAAAEERRRARFLGAQAAEDSTLSGVLLDLAERAETVVVTTILGNEHRLRVAALGSDFATLTGDGYEVVVALDTIQTVTVPDVAAVVGDRGDPVDVRLIDVLTTMVPDRPTLQVWTTGHRRVNGELSAVGRDVLRLRTRDHDSEYVPIAAIAEIVVGN